MGGLVSSCRFVIPKIENVVCFFNVSVIFSSSLLLVERTFELFVTIISKIKPQAFTLVSPGDFLNPVKLMRFGSNIMEIKIHNPQVTDSKLKTF